MRSLQTCCNPKYWLIGILSLYSSFALVGGIYFFPKDRLINFSLTGVVVYFIVALICFVFFLALIDFLQKIRFSQEDIRTPKQKKSFFLQSILLIFGIGLVYWILCYPGNNTPDASGISRQIKFSSYYDYHTVIIPILYKALLSIWYSPAIITLFQIIIFAWIFALWMSFFYEQGLSKKLLFWVFGILYALPINGVNAVTLWKDIQYTQALLLLSLLLFKIFIDKNKQKNTVFLIYLGISLALPLIFRHVGIFVFMFSSIILFFYAFYKKIWSTFFIPVSIAVICILSVEIGLRKAFNFRHYLGENKYSLILMPINTTYLYNESEKLPQVIKDKLISENSEDFWKTGSTSINGIVWSEKNQPYLQDIYQKLNNRRDFIYYYYSLWKDSPIIHLRTRLNLSDPFWNAHGVVYIYTPFTHWFPFEGYSRGRIFADFMVPLTTITNISNYIFPIWLSTIILFFLAIYFYLYNDKRKLVILVGWFTNAAGLFLVSPSADYRYFWIGTWIAIIGILLLMVKPSKNQV